MTGPSRESSTSIRTRPPAHWLGGIGFETVHEPGVSRAWRLETPDGYLLITDVGGYDLPDPGAPASAYAFSLADELLDFVEMLPDSRSIHVWISHARRRSRWRAMGSPRRDGAARPGAGRPS